MKRMNRLHQLAAMLTLVALATGTLMAQEAAAASPTPSKPAEQTLVAPISQPQIAYRILDDYANGQPEKDRKSQLAGGLVSIIAGGLLVVGGGVAAGLSTDTTIVGASDQKTTMWTGLGIAAGGMMMGGIGIGILASPLTDYHVKYRLVFDEPDPMVREALAASILKDMADNSRTSRIVSGIVPLALSILGGLAAVVRDTSDNKPWYTTLSNAGTISGLSTPLLYGIMNLALESDQERMYNKYRSARDAVYALPGQAK